LKNKRDTSTKLKENSQKMVRRHEESKKIDMGARKASPHVLSSWRQSKKSKISRRNEKPVVIHTYTEAQRSKRALVGYLEAVGKR